GTAPRRISPLPRLESARRTRSPWRSPRSPPHSGSVRLRRRSPRPSKRRALLPSSHRRFSSVLLIGKPGSDEPGNGFRIRLGVLYHALADHIDLARTRQSHRVAIRVATWGGSAELGLELFHGHWRLRVCRK